MGMQRTPLTKVVDDYSQKRLAMLRTALRNLTGFDTPQMSLREPEITFDSEITRPQMRLGKDEFTIKIPGVSQEVSIDGSLKQMIDFGVSNRFYLVAYGQRFNYDNWLNVNLTKTENNEMRTKNVLRTPLIACGNVILGEELVIPSFLQELVKPRLSQAFGTDENASSIRLWQIQLVSDFISGQAALGRPPEEIMFDLVRKSILRLSLPAPPARIPIEQLIAKIEPEFVWQQTIYAALLLIACDHDPKKALNVVWRPPEQVATAIYQAVAGKKDMIAARIAELRRGT